jgi:phosphoribosyl-ATP pyrophosphohydrolase
VGAVAGETEFAMGSRRRERTAAADVDARPGCLKRLASELADVLEVLQALAAAHHMSWEEVMSEARRKRAERGGFDKRIFLEYVDQAR